MHFIQLLFKLNIIFFAFNKNLFSKAGLTRSLDLEFGPKIRIFDLDGLADFHEKLEKQLKSESSKTNFHLMILSNFMVAV